MISYIWRQSVEGCLHMNEKNQHSNSEKKIINVCISTKYFSTPKVQRQISKKFRALNCENTYSELNVFLIQPLFPV